MRVNLHGIRTSPLTLCCLLAIVVLVQIAMERLMMQGPAAFYWQAVNGGRLLDLLSLILCWQVARLAESSGNRIQTATLFAVTLVQDALFTVIGAGAYLLTLKLGHPLNGGAPTWIYSFLSGWLILSYWLLLSRAARTSGWNIILIGLVSVSFLLYSQSYQAPWYWYSLKPEDTGEENLYSINQGVIEKQMVIAAKQREALRPGVPNVVELYSISYSPYSYEDVFWRESTMVSNLMQKRFGAEGHSQLLVNNPKTHASIAWASNLNLERAITAAAGKMNKEEDILFLYMTSHGGRDQQLSSTNWPIDVGPLTPAILDAMLKKAGIKYRVIAISACYSGSWIPPLKDDNAMVMTAADAEHTSYGCGSRSDLTFFGRAVFDEQLRSTYSFEKAFAGAIPVIRQRETDAKKEDGFSNPQIFAGRNIGSQLQLLEQHLAKNASEHPTPE